MRAEFIHPKPENGKLDIIIFQSREEALTPLPVRFSDHLLPDALQFYNDVLTSEEQERYERSMHDEWRMGGLRTEGIPIPENAESNLQHVAEMLKMSKDYSEKYSELGKYIHFSDVQIFALIHDLGELIVRDQPVRNRTEKQERLKKLEPRAGHRIIDKIQEETQRERVRVLYDRYMNNEDTDLEVQMTQFIDKVQGTSGVARMTTEFLEDAEKRLIIYNHLVHTLPRTQPSFSNLMAYLPEEDARLAIRDIYMGEIDNIAAFGHEEAVQTFRETHAA